MASENLDESMGTVSRKVIFYETRNSKGIKLEADDDDDEGRDESVDNVARKFKFDETESTNIVFIENDKKTDKGDVTRNYFALTVTLIPIIMLSISLLIIVLKENDTFQEYFPTRFLKAGPMIEEYSSNLITSIL